MSFLTAIRRYNWLLALVFLLLVALGLRLHRIGAEELWVDEADSCRIVTASDFWQDLRFNSAPPLYWLVLRGWVSLFGDEDVTLRLPSALAGVLFVLAITALGRELFNREVGLWTGLFATLAPIHVYYSQEARPYSMLLLLLTSAYLALCRAARRDRAWDLVLFAVLSALAVYCHYLALLALLPSGAILLAFPSRRQLRRWLASVLAALLLLVPWIPVTLSSGVGSQDMTGWIQQVWEQTPPRLAVPLSLEVLGLGSEAGLLSISMKQLSRVALPPPLRLLGLLALAVVALSAAFSWGDGSLGLGGLGSRKVLVATLMLLPLLILWLLSFAWPLYVVGRYDLLGFPGYCLGVGLGLAKLRWLPRFGALLSCTVASGFLLPMTIKLDRYYATSPQRISTVTAALLHEHVRDADVLYLCGLRAAQIVTYLRRHGLQCAEGRCRDRESGRTFGCWMYPRSLGTTPAKEPAREPRDSSHALLEEVGADLAWLKSPDSSVWVVPSAISISGSRIQVPPEDARLFEALDALGFGPEPIPDRPWIFRFRHREPVPGAQVAPGAP